MVAGKAERGLKCAMEKVSVSVSALPELLKEEMALSQVQSMVGGKGNLLWGGRAVTVIRYGRSWSWAKSPRFPSLLLVAGFWADEPATGLVVLAVASRPSFFFLR